MFKDLMKAILNEDVELDEEMEEEVVEETPVETPVVTKTVEPTYVAPKVQPIDAYSEPEIEMFTKPVVKPKKTAKSSIFSGLDVEEVSRVEPRSKNKPYKYDRRKMMKLRTSEDENYSPIISPIFGDIQEEKKEFDKVHDAIKLPKPTEDTSFVQIISPMYGSNIPTKPVEEIPSVKPQFKKKEENENKETLSLSEMLEKPKTKSTVQEDLFNLD